MLLRGIILLLLHALVLVTGRSNSVLGAHAVKALIKSARVYISIIVNGRSLLILNRNFHLMIGHRSWLHRVLPNHQRLSRIVSSRSFCSVSCVHLIKNELLRQLILFLQVSSRKSMRLLLIEHFFI